MTNIALVQELYRAFREHDDAAIRHVVAPDISWIQNDGFPDGATWHGADAIIEGVFGGNASRFEDFGFHVEEFLDAGQAVVVTGYYTGTHRETGNKLHAVAAHIYDIEGARITRFRQFADTKPIWDAMSFPVLQS